jgi:HD-like signal output (HDOD) protein
LAVNLPAEYEKVLQRAARESIPLFIAEEEALGVNHADVAGFILSLWGLPTRVVEAITHHHEPQVLAPDSLNPALAVHLANAVVHHKANAAYAESTLQRPILTAIGVNDTLKDWMSFAV